MARVVLSVPILLAALAVGSPAHAARCFSMFDTKNALVYQTSSAPIDMSRSIADQMARRFPARYLVISDAGSCPEAGPASVTSVTSAAALLPSRSVTEASSADYPGDPSPSGTNAAGRDVRVRGYNRDNGTTVQSYTRAAPGNGSTTGATGAPR